MKAISILQPWASLCVHTDENGKALKQIETRSWNTSRKKYWLIVKEYITTLTPKQS